MICRHERVEAYHARLSQLQAQDDRSTTSSYSIQNNPSVQVELEANLSRWKRAVRDFNSVYSRELRLLLGHSSMADDGEVCATGELTHSISGLQVQLSKVRGKTKYRANFVYARTVSSAGVKFSC